MSTEIYFQWMDHWNIGHWNLFSVNSFAENKVKVVECYTPYRSVKRGAHLPSLGRSAWQILWRSAGAKPDLRLPSQRRALPLSLDQYLFPFALRVGGWVSQVVGYIPRVYTGKWGCCTPFAGELGPVQHNVDSWAAGPRSISVPSGVLIHPAVWPQYIEWSDITYLWSQCDRHFVGQHVVLCVVKCWRFVALFE